QPWRLLGAIPLARGHAPAPVHDQRLSRRLPAPGGAGLHPRRRQARRVEGSRRGVGPGRTRRSGDPGRGAARPGAARMVSAVARANLPALGAGAARGSRRRLMVPDELIQALRQAPAGLAAAPILAGGGLDAADADVAEGILLLSPEVGKVDGRWRLLDCGRIGLLLDAIEAHAAASGRKLFRAEAALASLPAHEHPTQEE